MQKKRPSKNSQFYNVDGTYINKFAEFILTSGKSIKEWAIILERDPWTINLWMKNVRKPNDEMKERIYILSNYTIAPNDWFDLNKISGNNK